MAMHKGDSLTFSSSQGSDFGFSYAAWYSDVTHEVKAVTSGYRSHVLIAVVLMDFLFKTPFVVEMVSSWLHQSSHINWDLNRLLQGTGNLIVGYAILSVPTRNYS